MQAGQKVTPGTIREDFEGCRRFLQAIGDETRQCILAALLEEDPQGRGMRVGEITAHTHLSRPAVSHHLKILREAGVIRLRQEGTRNYYSIAARKQLDQLRALVAHLEALLRREPAGGK